MTGSSRLTTFVTSGHRGDGLYRHPSDFARLVVALTILGLAVLAAELRSGEISRFAVDVLALVDGLPIALVNGVVGLVQLSTLLVPPIAIVVLVRFRHWFLIALLALSTTLASITMAVLSGVVEESVPIDQLGFDRIDSWLIGGQYPSSTYLAAITACLVTASPWMTAAWRRTGWIFVVLVVVARTITSTEVPVRNLMLLAIGAAAGSLALLLFGAPRRRVDVETVRSALERVSFDVADIEARHDRRDAPTFVATLGDDTNVLVKVVGRDQRDSDGLLRVWRSLTLKGVAGGVPASPRRAVDREALALSIIGEVASTPRPPGRPAPPRSRAGPRPR